MCGITGFWQRAADGPDLLRAQAGRMADTLRHRGPDDAGVWADAGMGVGLGFRRLAILDLSPAGHQPMASPDGRYTVVFNGEVYNYRELRKDLEARGAGFRGSSDTEVMLAGFSRWGVADTIPRLNGMFAIAVWDATARVLTLARDRVGKKPLYYGRAGTAWVFGSELKAIRAHDQFRAEMDRDAVSLFMRYGYVPAPHSIFKGIRKLRPGHTVVLQPEGVSDERPYWDAAAIVRQGLESPLQVGDDEAIGALDDLLRDAVARRMIADVPLGAFLSGGIDSSAVVALMQAQSPRPVRTFTIGFHVEGYNEAEAAKAVAAHLGTDHTELYVTPDETRAVIPDLPRIYDEPFADSSQIPTLLVSKLARAHVTVSLSGDGGDELFAGYNRYRWGTAIWRRAGRVPAGIRRGLSAAVRRVPASRIDHVYRAVQPLLAPSMRVRLPGDKLHKLAGVLDAPGQMELYGRLVSAWPDPSLVTKGGARADAAVPDYLPDGFCERMMFRDLVTYLPDDILVKVDRASMAVSLEARAPLLDYRVIEFAWRLPMAMRIRDGSSKWLLRQMLYRYVPPALIERPKAGFGVPIDHWLRGPLRAWADELLDPAALADGDFLDPAPIRRVWAAHLTGSRNEQARLWPVLMFQAWRREWRQ